MTGAFRLNEGGRVDRARPLRFAFDGASYLGCAGDTVASALIANGVHLVGRSFKLHRPRGVLSLGPEEPNAIVSLDAGKGRVTPNLRAAQIELYEGLKASSQNAWPSREWDALSLVGLFADFMPAGFYYKTFMQPKGALGGASTSRRSAGPPASASRPTSPIPTITRSNTPIATSRSSAADRRALPRRSPPREAARASSCSTNRPSSAARCSPRPRRASTAPTRRLARRDARRARRSPRVKLLPRTQAFGYYAQNFIGAQQRLTDHLAAPDPRLPRERLWQVRAKRIVLATGANRASAGLPRQRPAGDHAGRCGADAVAALRRQAGLARRRRDDARFGLSRRARPRRGGHRDRDDRRPARRGRRRAAASGAPRRAQGRDRCGDRRLVRTLAGHARADRQALGRRAPAPAKPVACDSSRWRAAGRRTSHLYSQSRGKLAFDEALQVFLPACSAQAERSAGACRGAFGSPTRSPTASPPARGGGRRAGAAAPRGSRVAPPLRAASLALAIARGDQAPRQGVRRLPERRHCARHRAGRARGHALDRTHQALHHRRHGDRPGQDDQHERAGRRRRGARQADRRKSGSRRSARLTRR